MSKLEKIFANLPKAQVALQLGNNVGDALTQAFAQKRVVHPKGYSKTLSPLEVQNTWQKIVENKELQLKQRTAYIHIPFCKTKCLYCGFFQNYSNKNLEDLYVEKLCKEIKLAETASYLQQGKINAVFLGGGTPSVLDKDNIKKILHTLKKSLPLANDCEITLEARVNDLQAEKIEAWLENGVNRVSIGVQTFDTEIRQSIGRIDDKQTILRNLELLASYNQAAVIIDLMYGLPGQTLKIWQEDLELLQSTKIDGMDLYQLNVYEHSDLKKKIAAGEIQPAATTVQQAEMFAFAYEWLEKRPFRRLSNCHWAKTNRERSLYNTLNKQGAETLPFGAGAGGKLAGYSCMLHRDLNSYLQAVENCNKPIMSLSRQSELQDLYSAVLHQLEQGYLDIAVLESCGDKRLQELLWLLDIWEKRGLVKNNGVLFCLTIAGQFWKINIAQTIIESIHSLYTGETQFSFQKIAAQG